MKTAQQWFAPGGDGGAEEGLEPKTTENIDFANVDSSTSPATTTTSTPSTLNKRIDYNNYDDDDDDYYDDDAGEDRPYRADVVDAVKPMAVR